MIATVGTFDGVHSGHRYLLSRLRSRASELGLHPMAFVLADHPLRLICPERVPPLLMSTSEKVAALKRLDPSLKVEVLQFDERLRSLSHREFMLMLKEKFAVKALLIGHDNKIGADRDATPARYLSTGADLGLKVEICDSLPDVSSSIIRKALLEGDVAGARLKLGYPYTITGVVAHGVKIGRSIGFPTANLVPAYPHKLVPADGVYVALACCNGNCFGAVVNIGNRPTIDDSRGDLRTIEAHLLQCCQDCYGSQLTLRFLERLRGECRFDSLEQLREQIGKDVACAEKILRSEPPAADKTGA